MIDAKVNKGDIELECEGTMTEIGADIGIIIRSIYTRIFDRDIMAAVAFRDLITGMVADSDSPLFRYDYNEKKGE